MSLARSSTSTMVEVPGQPGTRVRVEVHHPDARQVAVLCSGLGLPLELWHPVVRALPQLRCVLHDRPGLGRSTPWDHEPGLAGQVELISATLAAAAVAPDAQVILVGHSYAALLVEAFARTNPDRVGGLVLVDPSIPTHEARLRTSLEHHPATARRLLSRAPWFGAWVGRMVLAAGTTPAGEHRAAARHVLTSYRDPHHQAGVLGELLRIGHEAAELLALAELHPLPRVPVRVIAANRRPRPLVGRNSRWLARAGQRAVDLDPLARLTEADASHLVMLDDPGAVARAIEDAAESTRS